MRKLTSSLVGAMLVAIFFTPPGVASAATIGTDSRVTRQTYVRHDGGTDPTIEICNSTAPTDYGNNTVNNEPFSVVDPATRTSWSRAGTTTARTGWASASPPTAARRGRTRSSRATRPTPRPRACSRPEYIRTNNASDPLGAFDTHGPLLLRRSLAYNGNAGPKTNAMCGWRPSGVRRAGSVYQR